MRKKSKALRVVLLAGWVLGLLVPLYSFRHLSPSYRAAFDWVFRTHTSHVVMHTFLYAVLAWLFASLAPRSLGIDERMVFFVLGAVLVIAVAQETIQMMSERMHLGSDELFDLFVDLNGGMLGALLFLKTSRHRAGKSTGGEDGLDSA